MATQSCPCGSKRELVQCCGRFHCGEALPQTAEELMRSRYSAYVLQRIAYLRETLWPRYRPGFDEAAAARWASESNWIGLSILATEKGQAGDTNGTVLFIARYLAEGELREHRELSLFRKKSGRWYYVEGLPEPA